jgi:hypothetical protein
MKLGKFLFQASWGKRVCDTQSPWKKLGIVVNICHSSEGGSIEQAASCTGCPEQKVRPYLQSNQNKKNWSGSQS